MNYFWVFIIIFAGAFVQGITGFGSAMVWMSFLPLVVGIEFASALTPLMLTCIGIQMSLKLYKQIKWKTTLVPLIVSMVSTSLGVWILTLTTAHTMQIILGAFLVLVGVYFFATSKRPIKIAASPVNGGIAGLIAGTFTGLLNIGGPPLAVYYNAAAENPMEYKANIEFNFFIMYGWATILKAIGGAYTTQVLYYAVPGLVGVIAGSVLGLALFSKFDKKLVSRLVWTMLIIMGIYQLIKAFNII